MFSKNALIITNKVRKIPGGMLETCIKPLKDKGYNVYWAGDFSYAKFDLSSAPCELIQTPFRSNPLNPVNIKAFFVIKNQLKKLDISLIHCNTPIGGLIGRIAGITQKVPCIIYQAHGFLFFKGGPKLGWLYKIIEKHFSRYADILITINDEDFSTAKKFKLRRNGLLFKVHGSGMTLDFERLRKEDFLKRRRLFNIEDDTTLLISIGELNKNKNVRVTIKALSLLNDDVKLFICGEGKERKSLEKLANKLSLTDRVQFLGYRNDVIDLIKISDIYVSSSLREGLSRTISESMAAGLPCVVSNRRGLKDLIDNNGGFLFEPNDAEELAKCIRQLNVNRDLKIKMGEYNQNKIKTFTSNVVRNEMETIYSKADELIKEFRNVV